YPYDGTVIDHVKPQAAAKSGTGLTLTIPAGYAFTHNKAPAMLEGVIAFQPGGKAFELTASPAKKGEMGAAAPGPGGDDGGVGGLPGALA
ncbi:hypothetical protein ABTA68_19730, partial [Acinetobacter baumannii]